MDAILSAIVARHYARPPPRVCAGQGGGSLLCSHSGTQQPLSCAYLFPGPLGHLSIAGRENSKMLAEGFPKLGMHHLSLLLLFHCPNGVMWSHPT